MACRKSVLFNNGKVWTKKDKDFDVTMGAQDGAEIAELTGIFKKNTLSVSMKQKGHTVNVLDVTLTTDGSHKPYKKPNSNITYVSRASNHPPNISRNIPTSIKKKLNTISSSEDEFDNSKDDYQKALFEAGYMDELKYDPEHNKTTRTSRRRKRNMVWFNPPYSRNVATNIGKEFFNLLQIHFPKQHPYTAFSTGTR